MLYKFERGVEDEEPWEARQVSYPPTLLMLASCYRATHGRKYGKAWMTSHVTNCKSRDDCSKFPCSRMRDLMKCSPSVWIETTKRVEGKCSPRDEWSLYVFAGENQRSRGSADSCSWVFNFTTQARVEAYVLQSPRWGALTTLDMPLTSLYSLIGDFGKFQNKCTWFNDSGQICYCDDMYLCQIGG